MTDKAKLVQELTELDDADWADVLERARRERQNGFEPEPTLPKTPSRDELAQWCGRSHLAADPGIKEVIYLPGNAPPNEIRLLEVNLFSHVAPDAPIEPIDFGSEPEFASRFLLLVADVTPEQWEAIKQGQLPLPAGWVLDGNVSIRARRRSADG